MQNQAYTNKPMISVIQEIPLSELFQVLKRSNTRAFAVSAIRTVIRRRSVTGGIVPATKAGLK